MPRKDIFHDSVVIALEKEGWKVTNDPLRIVAGGVGLFIDIAAEPIISLEKDNEKIAIEIKSFGIQSAITSFYETLGKYLTYRKALEMSNKNMDLYLAVPQKAFESIFQKDLIKAIVLEFHVHLFVYQPNTQTIQKWIKH